MAKGRPGKFRMIIYIDAEEDMLLRVVSRTTGLDKTRALRLMLRYGCIEEMIRWNKKGYPHLPEDVEAFIENFFTTNWPDRFL